MARRPKAPKELSTLFNATTGTLAQIQEKTNSLRLLSDIVRQICPDLPQDAFNIANFVRSTLIVEVKSPVWGQRLQFERNTICQQLIKQTQGQFTQIEIKVNPYGHKVSSGQPSAEKNTTPNTAHTTVPTSVQNMSSDTASHLLDIAEHAPDGLKQKLRKLVANAKR